MLGRVGILVGFVVLSVLLVGSLWVVPYLPTNDGPEWVFATHVENHYSDPGAPYSDEYVPAPQFASRGFTALYGPLEAWLGWQRGLTAALSVVVLVVAWGFVALVRAVDPSRTSLGFLGFPLALSWSFYMGFWAFALALGGGFFVLAFAARDRGHAELATGTRAIVSLLLLLVAIAHVFAAVLTGLALAFLLVLRAEPTRRKMELGKVVGMGLPAAGIAAASALVAHKVAFAEDVAWLPWRDAIAVLPQTFWPGPFARAALALGLVMAAGVVAAVRTRRTETRSVDRGLGVAAIVLLLAAVFAPLQVPGWQFLSQRFVTPGIALALAVLPFERLPTKARRFAGMALFVVATASVGLSYPMHRRLAALCADAIAGLSAPIHRRGMQLPVTLAASEASGHDLFRSEVPMWSPLLHMGALYAAVEGGLIPYVFATSAATHPFTLRPHDAKLPIPSIEVYWPAIDSQPFQDDLSFRHSIEDDLASFGTLYEGVILAGARPDDVTFWHSRGYVADWERGATFLGHFEPCSIDFSAPGSAAGTLPTFDVALGRFAALKNARVPPTVGPDGAVHFLLPRTPCGDVQVRARWLPTSPGVPPRICGNADSVGTLHATVTRSSHRVWCSAVVDGLAEPAAARAPRE